MGGQGSSGGYSRQRYTREDGAAALKAFTEGGTYEMLVKTGHKDPMFNGSNFFDESLYDPKAVDQEYVGRMDAAFSPAKSDMTLYKGMQLYDEEIDDAMSAIDKGRVITNHAYSSTSTDRGVAAFYGDGDGETTSSVTLRIHVRKGTPVADVMGTVGGGSMRGFEKEVTIGRNTKWAYRKARVEEDRYGDRTYYFDVDVWK